MPKAYDDPVIDPNEMAAVKIAIREAVKGFTYMGISVGSYITEDMLQQVAFAALTASANYRGGETI